ncbi:MAG TPA: AMP-binding protein [Polyangiales bacterium]
MNGHEVAPWSELLSRCTHDQRPWLIVDAGSTSRSERRVICYAELAQRARQVGACLRRLVPAGARVLIVMDNSAESAIAVVGALVAGVVSVPVAAPSFGQTSERWLSATRATYEDCGAQLLVGPSSVVDACSLLLRVAHTSFSALEQVADGREAWTPSPANALALLQYTSGSTARQRGVRLSHAQLVSNLEGIGCTVGVRSNDVGLCWLPLAHDMGLIGSLLFTTYWQIALVLMKPQAFATRPESWLALICRERATLCAAPNSAYWLCATKLPEHKLNGLDLSSWRVAINGAEPIHAETVRAFCRRFAPYGFQASAMRPAYGLAECATALCVAPSHRQLLVDRVDADVLEQHGLALPPSPGTLRERELVAVGRPLPSHEVRIVGPGRGPVSERHVGAIQVRGPSVTSGYFAAPPEAEPLHAEDGWLWTGDRGYLAHGELYVLGRSKATLKRAGRSIDCAFIEGALRALPGVRAGRVAALGVPTLGVERLVVVVETDLREPDARTRLSAHVHEAVRHAVAFGPDVVLLLTPGSIPHTTSGKVRYDGLRAAYCSGELASRALHTSDGALKAAQEAPRS